MTMRRRTFLKGAAGSAVVAAAGPTLARPARPKERPNILVIMSDEHDAGVTGCYGNQIVQTPNIDRIAQRGITFD